MDLETGKGINSPGIGYPYSYAGSIYERNLLDPSMTFTQLMQSQIYPPSQEDQIEMSNSKDESLTGYTDDCGGWEEVEVCKQTSINEDNGQCNAGANEDADGVVHNVVAEPFDHSEASRCYSFFNCGHDDEQKGEVNSNSRHVRASVIEDSMRKFCEDLSYHMFKPEVEVKFESLEEAYQFYNMYSWVTGFSIKCGDNYTNGRRVKTLQEYKCQREGFTKAVKMSTTRCGCKAMVRLAMADSVNTSSWYVRAFVEEHNHELVDSSGEKNYCPRIETLISI